VRGCGVKSRVAHGNPADRIREGKKSFCCVTTRVKLRRIREHSPLMVVAGMPLLFNSTHYV
jgi:hypothetical protein